MYKNRKSWPAFSMLSFSEHIRQTHASCSQTHCYNTLYAGLTARDAWLLLAAHADRLHACVLVGLLLLYTRSSISLSVFLLDPLTYLYTKLISTLPRSLPRRRRRNKTAAERTTTTNAAAAVATAATATSSSSLSRHSVLRETSSARSYWVVVSGIVYFPLPT